MITFVVGLLGWALYLKVTIFYGAKKVNKLTFKPFNSAIIALSFRMLSLVFQVFYDARQECLKTCSFESVGNMLQSSPLFWFLTISMFCSQLFYIVFVADLFQEHRILWHFIWFQAKTPFNQLDVKKSEYQRTETLFIKQLKRMKIGLAAFVAVFCILLIAFGSADRVTEMLKIIRVYYIVAIMMVTYLMLASLFVGYLYMQAMYFFQNLEFRRHRFRIGLTILMIMMALFNLTE